MLQIDVAHAMAIARFTERVHGRTDPNADDDYDFTSLIGGRWVAVNPLLKAKDLTNDEAVHMALALQTLLQKVADSSWIVDDEDSPIDRWLSKRSCREQVELLDAYVQQAQIAGNFDLIVEHLIEAADRPNGLTGEDRFFGRPGVNSYFFKVPAHGFNGDANSPLALNCSNLLHPLPEGWMALTDPVLKKTYYYHTKRQEPRDGKGRKPNDQPNPEVSEHVNLAPIESVKVEAEQLNEPQPTKS
jgi:hypothetical protein